MSRQSYQEISLSEIRSNPRNPRKSFSGPKFDDLVKSIQEKGVIEPIIVRPISGDKGAYEIVAGERRFKAACILAEKNEGKVAAAIPAMVKALNDEEAFDFMLIENLQREDLTEFEEAESFKAYIGKHGEEGIRDLGQKIGISPQYIRRRMAVLSLPEYALAAWRKGRIRYGHLEQLLRVKGSPELKEFFRVAVEEGRWSGPTTIEDLKRRIDGESPAFKIAYFPITPEGCGSCPKNSMVQKELFGIEEIKGTRCLDPACFKKKQNDWLLGHWKESPLHKKYGTNGFKFRDKVGYNDHETIRSSFKPDEKCKACQHFLTIIDSTGEVSRSDEQECFNKPCLRSRTSKMRGDISKREKQERKPGDPRVSWHGEYFRDLFFEKRIPETLAGFAPASNEMITLLFLAALHGNTNARETIGKALKTKDAGMYMNQARLYATILGLPYAEVDKLIPETVKAIVMEGQHVGDYSGFGTTNRFAVARFLGIDLAKEWTISQEYLEKKTIREMLYFGKKSGIFKEKKAQDYLIKTLKKKPGAFESCKKKELIQVFLKSGVGLVGKVPDEIIKKGR